MDIVAKTQQKGKQIKDGSVRAVDIDFGLDAGDVNSAVVPTDTTNFDHHLSSADADVQKALDTLDDIDFDTPIGESIIAQDFDDFVQGTTASGDLGKWGWTIFDISRPSNVYKAPPFDRYGVIGVESKNKINSGVTISTSSKDNFRSKGDMRFRLSVESGPIITNAVYRFGFHDERNKIKEPENGIYFEYDTDTSTNWYAVTAKNGVRTKTDTTIAVSVDTWYKLEAIVNSANNSIQYKINNTVAATITTNIPSSDGNYFTPAMTIYTRNNITKKFFIDYYWMYLPLLDR